MDGIFFPFVCTLSLQILKKVKTNELRRHLLLTWFNCLKRAYSKCEACLIWTVAVQRRLINFKDLLKRKQFQLITYTVGLCKYIRYIRQIGDKHILFIATVHLCDKLFLELPKKLEFNLANKLLFIYFFLFYDVNWIMQIPTYFASAIFSTSYNSNGPIESFLIFFI